MYKIGESNKHVARGIIFNDRDEVLLAKRNDCKHNNGFWEFPGGKVDLKDGERFLEGVFREIAEETHVAVQIIDPDIVYTHRHGYFEAGQHITNITQFCLGFANDEQIIIDPKEVAAALWVPTIEIAHYSLTEASRGALEFFAGASLVDQLALAA